MVHTKIKEITVKDGNVIIPVSEIKRIRDVSYKKYHQFNSDYFMQLGVVYFLDDILKSVKK